MLRIDSYKRQINFWQNEATLPNVSKDRDCCVLVVVDGQRRKRQLLVAGWQNELNSVSSFSKEPALHSDEGVAGDSVAACSPGAISHQPRS